MKSILNKGDLLELEIVDLTSEGLGVGKKDGFAIFVQGGLPGDKGIVKLKKVKKNYGIGEMLNIKNPSQSRV